MVGTEPPAVVADGTTNEISVANSGSNTVTVIGGATSPASVEGNPQAVAVDPATNKVHVGSAGNGTLPAIAP